MMPRRSRWIARTLATSAAALLLTAAAAAAAPLAGTYVVGSGGDYATLTAAGAALIANGVSAPVTFQLKTGTYTEALALTAITGVSSTNRVTFTSQSGVASDVIVQAATISSTGSDSPFLLNGAQYVSITNMTLQSSSSAGSTGGGLVWLSNNSPNNTVSGCVMNTVGGSRAAVHTSPSTTVDNLQVVNCQISLPLAGCYGVLLVSSGSANNVVVQNNVITCGAGTGNFPIYVAPTTTGFQILGNTISPGNSGVAISIQGSATGLIVRGNRIIAAGTGLNLSGSLGGGSLVTNNMIQASAVPITMSGPSGVTLAFNSILNTSTSNAALTINGGNAGSVTLKNNVFACFAGAVPLFAGAANVLAAPDYDDLYTSGGVVAQLGGIQYATLSALQTALSFEAHGIAANPGFVSSSDLHARAPALNNAGTPLGTVLDDFDGSVRSLSTPDIGADEFSTALAPMAGSYTVGASGTYSTPAAAAADVCLRGVSAPVSFLLQSGTYTGTVLLTPVTGANAVNRVRFVAQSGLAADAILQAPALLTDGSDAAVRYEGSRYVDLDSLTLQTSATGASNGGGVVWMLYNATLDRLQGCRINSNNSSCSGIRGSGATVDTLVVSGCQFASLASLTGSVAVQLSAGGTSNAAVFSNNTVNLGNNTSTGFYLATNSSGLTLSNNVFTMSGGTAVQVQAGSSSGCIIRGNRVSGAVTALNASALVASSLIANNFFQASAIPITLSNATGVTLAFNSLQAGSSSAALTVNSSSGGAVTLRNNIFACIGGAQAIIATAGAIGSADYDDYYVPGPSLASIATVPYSTLAAFQAATGLETHAVTANPGFVSGTDLHARAPALDNTGSPLAAVLDDIDGQVRSATTPDIGADEFSASAGPMAGIYTVGASGTYATPAAAATDVGVRGISAPVSFLIQSGTYTGTIVMTPVSGANVLTRVRFVAQSGVASDVVVQAASLQSDGSDSAIRFEGGRYVDVDSLTIQPTATAGGISGANVMTLYESVADRFQGCVFNIPSSSCNGIRTTTGYLDSLLVTGCQFNVGGAGSTGVQFGNNPSVAVSVVNNTFVVNIATAYGFYSSTSTPGLLLQGNFFSMSNATGMSLSGSTSGAITIRANRILGSSVGMSIGTIGGGSLIANNFVQSSSYAITLNTPTSVSVVFNTLLSTGANAVIFNGSGAAGGLTLKNNAFAGVGGGPLLNLQAGSLGAADYNDYYTTGTTVATVGGTNYASLAAFQQATGFESLGIAANPGFVSSTDLHSTAPALNNVGTPLAAVLDDIDGETRSVTAPDIGADEFSTSLTPMAGTYVVGASGVYATPAAAAAAVEVRGISGPVSFAIQPGTYNGTTLLTPITGANPVNRVQFTSQTGVAADVILQAATNLSDGSDAVFLINGARYADMTNLTLRSTGTPANPPGGLVWMLGGCIGDRLQGCALNTVSTYRVGIRSQGATIDSTQFLNNQITVAGTASYGVEITIPGTANSTVFSGNTFNMLGSGVDAIYVNSTATGLVIQNQLITFSGGGSGTALDMSSSSVANGVIRANRIYGATNGMTLFNLSNTLIANNMIQGTGYPLQLASPINVTVAFNSLNSTSSLPALFVQATGSSSLTLENNVFACSGTPRAMQILGAPPSVLTLSDANDLFTTGPTLAAINGIDYATLAALRTATGQDVHDVNVNPAYTSSTDLHTAAPGLDGKALHLDAVLDDYDGQLRNATTPDIGADEFTIGSVDVTPPNTSIVSGPADGGWTASSSATFGWSGIDDISLPATLRFEYSLDGGAYSAPAYATSNLFSGLTEGAHTIAVRAVDEVGNIDATPATRSFNVDVTAPDTQILTGPAEGSTVAAANAVFTIAGTDNLTAPAQVGFLYSIDGGGLNGIGPVTTISLTSLANGSHTLQVYAQDLAGNMDQTPAMRHFTVATVYNPTADWSDSANPNGPWGYNEGTNLLPHVSAWTGTTGDFSTAQPAWARAASGNTIIPAIFKSSATVVPAHDWLTGDVIMHTTDPSFGVGGGAGNITWTSPAAATISISGGVWMGRDIGRSNHWALYLNGALLTAGDVSSGDIYSRSSPFNFAAGTGGAGAISSLIVGAGDVIKLELTKNSISGDYTGIQMQIQAVATTGTAPKPVIIAGPANGGYSQASTAFTWTLGAHSAPPASIRYATRLDAATTGAFLVDTTVTLTGLATGAHTLWVIAKDNLALRDSTSRTWTVDVAAPTVAIATGPLEGGYSTAAPTFGWSGTDNLTPANQIRYAYSLDGAAFTAPATATSAALSGLAAGAHTLAVHSVDLAGNLSTDVTRHWTVDVTAPETQIVSGPANASTIGANSTTFGFTGTDDITPTASLSYQSRLDGGAWSATAGSTIATLTSLADGPHTFDVRAVDLGGNLDATPASRSFTVDALGPVVSIVTGPASNACLNTASASFTWSATDAVTPQGQIQFAWQLDGGIATAFGASTSTTLNSLAEGQHTFTIQSRDGSGHVTSLARTFQVDVTTPLVNAPTARALDSSVLRVQCSATDIGGVIGYHVQISTSPAFGTTVADVSIGSAGLYDYTGTPGSTYYARATASDCSGNTSAFSGPSNPVVLANLPNLVVAAVTGPPTATGGLNAQVSFTISNAGIGPTSAPSWNDYIYLSPTATFNAGTAVLAVQKPNLSVLAPGESYVSTATVNIPIGTSGTWYVIIKADGGDAQPETDGTDNLRASGAIAVALGAFADLHVTAVVAPPTALSSDVVTVNWTVQNTGSGRTNATDWWDTILLSSDTNFDFTVITGGLIRCIDLPLARLHHVGALDPGASYNASTQIQLPGSFGGKRFVLVQADLNATSVNSSEPQQGDVFENQLDINTGVSDSMIVTQEQPSDLTVDALAAPTSGASGGSVQVSFTVGNHGFNATPAYSNWSDKVWFSADNALDANDVLMGTFSHTGTLALGANYATTANLAIPQGFTGTYFVIVQTDAGSAVPEFDETNNTRVSTQALSITLSPWANLVPSATGVSASVPAGGSGTANWKVTNNGVATAFGTWSDVIEFGTAPNWTSGLTVVATQRAAHTLASGQSYDASATLTIPVSFSGTYYAFARTDAVNEIYEYSDEGDNVVALGPVTVTPHAPVDLVVSNLTSPASGTGAQPINVAWSVTNQGTGSTLAGSWGEDAWLSSDPSWSASDVQLSSPGHSGTLTASAHYTRSISPTLPPGLNGTYYVIVRTDPAGTTGDASLANNVVASAPVTISSPPPPQLTASNLVVGANPVAGQPAQVSFDVHNVGAGAVPNAPWSSSVYLSTDPFLDPGDAPLGTIADTPGLGVGASENRSLSVTIPAWASGPYYVIALADSRGEVWENGLDGDNTTFTTTLITLPPPADLVVQNVQVPGAAVPGQPVTVSFTLKNQGVNPAVGVLQNAVYVSSDANFAATDDPLVGIQSTTINLAPGGTTQMSMRVVPDRPLRVDATGVTSALPPISPGSYFAIVRANIQANIRELVSDNNSAASAGTILTDVPALALGVGAPFPLIAAQSGFYKVTVPAGVDLTLNLASDVPDATNEMYVAYGRVPQLTDFDFSWPGSFTANPAVLVPQTLAGTYYVMVVAHSLGSLATTENETLTAQTLPFSVAAISPAHGGAGGRVTVRVQGAGLRDTTTFTLEQFGIPRASATVAKFTNSTDVLARFDLTSVGVGPCDLVAHNGAITVVVPNAFTVEQAQPMAVTIMTENADLFRRSATGNFTVRLQNSSNQDVPIVQARILFPGTSSLRSISSDPALFRMTQLEHGLSGLAGDAVMLHRADGTDSLWSVDVIGANLAPGESRAVTLALSGFASSPYSVRVLAAAMTTGEFLNRQAASVEAARRVLLSSSVGLPDSLPLLAADPYNFRDRVLYATYVSNPVISGVDLGLLPPHSPSLPAASYPQPAGPQGLLDDLATGGPCPQPAAIPECKPDVAPPGSALPACTSVFDCDGPVPLDIYGGVLARIPWRTSNGFDLTRSVDVRMVVPCDPNLMTGPAGFGTEHWVNATTPMRYRVDFENLPGVASAPAQVVHVTVPIDPGLDVTTFRVGEMGFGGSNVITVPPNRTSYSSQATYPNPGLTVLVTAGVNPTTRLATWTFTTIDPATGSVPTNPLIGFLPVNDQFGSGTGYVTLTVQPAVALPSGSTVKAQGTIQFDVNSPIPTVSASNRVDDRSPTSLTLNPVQVLDPTRVRVTWNSADDTTGAGLAAAALYMKTDQGTFAQIGSVAAGSNSLDVPVVNGHYYGFYSLASDNAGNVEPGKSSVEAAVTVGGAAEVQPKTPLITMLHPNYPNPFRGTTTIWFDLATSEAVTLEVFDLQGRRVQRPLDSKRMEPGSYRIALHDVPGGPGVYFYRFHAGAYEQARKLVMLK